MGEAAERLFQFPDAVRASLFVRDIETWEGIHRRVWIGPFVRVPVPGRRSVAVERLAAGQGGEPVGRPGGPVPSIERMLGEMEGYREIYGGVPEDEGGEDEDRVRLPRGQDWGGGVDGPKG